MSLTPSAIRMLAEKGLTALDIADIAEANAPTQSSGAVRQKRYRDNKRNERDVTRDVTPPLNDIYSKPPEPIEAKASTPPIELKLVSEWNAGAASRGARKATRLDASRKKLLAARLRENTEAEIFQAMANLAASRFHCGENDRNWRASLGWFLKAENFLKALEMDEAKPASTTGQFDTPEAQAAFLAKIADKPWSRPADKPPDRPAAFSQPPRTIGQIAKQITQEQAA